MCVYYTYAELVIKINVRADMVSDILTTITMKIIYLVPSSKIYIKIYTLDSSLIAYNLPV